MLGLQSAQAGVELLNSLIDRFLALLESLQCAQ